MSPNKCKIPISWEGETHYVTYFSIGKADRDVGIMYDYLEEYTVVNEKGEEVDYDLLSNGELDKLHSIVEEALDRAFPSEPDEDPYYDDPELPEDYFDVKD